MKKLWNELSWFHKAFIMLFLGFLATLTLNHYRGDIEYAEWQIQRGKQLDKVIGDFRDGKTDTVDLDYGLGWTLEVIRIDTTKTEE